MFVDFFLISRYLRHEQDCSEITVQSLARLFVPVIIVQLFFKQWFTYFCDIYVFLVQLRIKVFLSPQPSVPL